MKPNHVCKLSTCRKEYYACLVCDHTESWRSMTCCEDHYHKYIEEVLAARASGKEVDLLPDRTDMTKEEIKELKMKPLSVVQEETKKELKEYVEEDGSLNVKETVKKINKEINKNARKK